MDRDEMLEVFINTLEDMINEISDQFPGVYMSVVKNAFFVQKNVSKQKICDNFMFYLKPLEKDIKNKDYDRILEVVDEHKNNNDGFIAEFIDHLLSLWVSTDETNKESIRSYILVLTKLGRRLVA